jgi:hypothetical protein
LTCETYKRAPGKEKKSLLHNALGVMEENLTNRFSSLLLNIDWTGYEKNQIAKLS